MIELTTRYRTGDLAGAEAAFTTGQSFFKDERFTSRPGAIPQTFGNASLVAILLGNMDEARRRASYALTACRTGRSPYDACFAAYMTSMAELLLGADQKADALASRALRLAAEVGFPQFEAIARIALGRARTGLGHARSGIGLIEQGLEGMSGTYSRNAQTLYLTWLAEAALADGDAERALDATRQAVEINSQELFYRPETMRVRALSLAIIGSHDRAVAACREGLRMAADMNGRWFLERMRPLQVRLRIAA